MIKTLNQKIQTHFAFFGPKWFCWSAVFIGFELWIVEGTLKAFGYGEYGPGFKLIEYADLALDTKNYILFGVLLIVISFICFSFLVYFPSFMFLLSGVAVDHYTPNSVTKYYLMYFGILTSPIWYNWIVNRISLGVVI